MKIRQLVSVILLFIISLLPIVSLPVYSQTQSASNQIQISPPVAYVKVGESYNLRIFNNTIEPFNFSILPNLFTFNTTDRTIVPLQNTDLNGAEYITINTANNTFVLLAGESLDIPIDYVVEPPSQLIPGVLISSQGSEDDDIAVGFSTASIIINPEWSEEEVNTISQELFISPNLGIAIPNNSQIAAITIGRDVQVKAVIKNTTDRILINPSGELNVFAGGTHIQTESITQKFPSSIYANEEFSFDQPFNDSRPFYQRIGMIDYTFEFTLDDKTISKSISILSLPYEIFLILLVLIIAITLTVRVVRNRKNQ